MEKGIWNKLVTAWRRISEAIVDDTFRQCFMLKWQNVIFAFISLVMSLFNLFTEQYVLMTSTLVYCVLCVVNVLFCRRLQKVNWFLTCVTIIETLALLTFFFVSGMPNGFGAIWAVFIPSFSLLIFGVKIGLMYSGAMFAIMVFLFWVPFGRSLLQFSYTPEFMQRFPLLYLAVLVLAFLVESVRMVTQLKLKEAEQKYYYLYRHDALAGVLNRYGFDEMLSGDFVQDGPGDVSVLIFDLDGFKGINDTYGHNCGDMVLARVAALSQGILCECCKCCRWGGDEFATVMVCGHDPLAVAESIRRAVEQEVFVCGEQQFSVTISMGVCTAHSRSSDVLDECFRRADKCLYQAKKSGSNRVVGCEL